MLLHSLLYFSLEESLYLKQVSLKISTKVNSLTFFKMQYCSCYYLLLEGLKCFVYDLELQKRLHNILRMYNEILHHKNKVFAVLLLRHKLLQVCLCWSTNNSNENNEKTISISIFLYLLSKYRVTKIKSCNFKWLDLQIP